MSPAIRQQFEALRDSETLWIEMGRPQYTSLKDEALFYLRQYQPQLLRDGDALKALINQEVSA